MITIDPSKYCHSVKLLDDKAEDCQKHVEELTWQLDDEKFHHLSASKFPTLNGNHSKNKECEFLPLTSKKFNNDLRASVETEKLKKGSPLRPKSHVSCNIRLQQEIESSRKRQKLDGGPSKTAKAKKQTIVEKKLSSSVDKLSNDKRRKSAETQVQFGDHENKMLDSSKSKVLLNGDEETGFVSFIDEAEENVSFPPCQKTPLSYLWQESTYNEFQSAVIDEYVDRKPAANVGSRCDYRKTDHDSSDEDAFDLIASGRINRLIQRSQASASDRSQAVNLDRRTNFSSVPAELDYHPAVTRYQKGDKNACGYDSASSADTDVVIRSHRVMSEVKANLWKQAVSPLQPNPDSSLYAGNRHLSASGKQQLLNVVESVSPSQSSAASRIGAEQKRKRKRCARDDSESAVKNCDTVDSCPSLQQLTPVTIDRALPKSSPKKCRSAEHKLKHKLSEVDDSEGRVKTGASVADNFLVQQPKSVSMPNRCDIDKSDIKRRKTDVSALVNFIHI